MLPEGHQFLSRGHGSSEKKVLVEKERNLSQSRADIHVLKPTPLKKVWLSSPERKRCPKFWPGVLVGKTREIHILHALKKDFFD